MRQTTKTTLGLLTGICLAIAACGNSSPSDADVTVTAGSSSAEPPATDVPTTEPPETTEEVVQTTDPIPVEEDSNDPVQTDVATGVDNQAQLHLDTILTLPERIEAAVSDPTSALAEPIDIARDVIGFAYAIPAPEGSTLFEISGGVRFLPDEDEAVYDFEYSVIAPNGIVPDIDINLDDNGPGSVEIIAIYDPIMGDLGFERANSTGSDPGDSGGPNSVNHVYVHPGDETVLNGVAGTVGPVFIWSDEDVNQGSYSEARETLAGYRYDYSFTTSLDDGIPVPLVTALLEMLPLPEGLTLSDININMRNREAGSFSIEKGNTFTDIKLEWEASPDELDAIISFYGNPAEVFANAETLMAGEEDFFNEGTIVATEPYEYDTTGRRLDLLLARRHGATLGIDASADGTEPMTVFFDLELNPVAPELALPAG